MRKIAPLAILVLLAACGRGDDATSRQPANAEEAVADSDDAGDVAEPSEPLPPAGESGITGIDASVGDARRMPADFNGPSAYDLAQRKAANRERTPARPAAAPRAATIEPKGADLLGADETLTTGR